MNQTKSELTRILFLISCFITFVSVKMISYQTDNVIFREDQVIFRSNYNITSILVPSQRTTFVMKEFTDIPSIFFTISDPILEGGSCIYVLEGLAAFEVLEGGRDSTCDSSNDKLIYFGAKDGVYIYNSDTLSAKKFGLFSDNIIQIQKAKGIDLLYYLTAQKKMYKLRNNGTVRTRISVIACALSFVLDNADNIYFIYCNDGLPYIVNSVGDLITCTLSVSEHFKNIQLLRPAFVMDKCVPFFVDDSLYILYANGSSEKKDLHIREKPSAYSIDAGFYLVAALKGKIYEFNVMEHFIKSMFGFSAAWPNDLTNIVMSTIETIKDSLY